MEIVKVFRQNVKKYREKELVYLKAKRRIEWKI